MHDTTNPSNSATRLHANILRVMLDNAVDAQFVLDYVRDAFLAVNPAMCELTGYSEDELLSRSFLANSLVHPEDVEQVVRERRLVMEQGQTVRRYRLVRRTGVVRWVETRSRHVPALGPNVLVTSARDITDQANLEKQFRARMDADAVRLRDSEDKAREVVRSNARLYGMVQMLEAVPRITSQIASQDTVDEVFRHACLGITSRDRGLGYPRCTIWVINSGHLEIAFANPFRLTMRIPRENSAEFQPVLDRTTPLAVLPGLRRLAPISSRGEVIGVLDITLPGKGDDEDDPTRTAHDGVITSLADFIGVQVTNLRLLARIQQEVVEDSLTGLYNRRYFLERIEEEFRRACRYGRPMSLLMLDIDHFKEVNDTHGHPLGDEVLRRLGQLLRQCFRDLDTVCRIGGEEFAVIMPETPVSAAALKAGMVRQLIEGLKVPLPRQSEDGPDPEPLGITISIGVAGLSPSTSDWEQLYQEADRALYDAKQGGRNRVSVSAVSTGATGPIPLPSAGRATGSAKGG